ncbi:hypothetical protein ACFU96_27360 [Streptomyces sp. NPDC057620]|uniref:hypothetical protein n=1 Tax=Streptomyces sp. NPDC057620 TaxID=3346185 RepID=UPI0036CACC52
MDFPEDELGLRVEVQSGLAWLDITQRCKLSDPITHQRGIRNGGSIADTASVGLKIDNADGYFSPRNPMSPMWGLIGRNTPVRLWLPDADHFLDLDGDPANYVSTPDNAALDITGDLDLRVEAEISWNDPTANQVLIQKWSSPGQRSYALRVFDQLLNFTWSDDGTTNRFAAQPLPALPERAAVRATLDVNDGTGQYAARLYWAPTIAGPWTEIGAGRFGAATSIFSGTAPLRVGGDDPTTVPPRKPFIGKGYKAEVRNGINGTLVAAPDFTAQPLGAAGFTDSAGRSWSFSGNAVVADRVELFAGEISSWPQDWVPSGEAVWTSVTAAGILRRFGQGQKALDSTLRRRIPSAGPVAYWPMEEDAQASRAYSPIKGVQAAAVTGVEWASTDTLPSSRALPRLTAAATLSAIVPAAVDGEWQVECVYNADDKKPPAAGPWAEVLSISTTGTVRRWVITMRDGSARIYGYNAAGDDVVFTSVSLDDVFHGWYRLRFYVQDLGGGTLEWTVGWANVNGTNVQLSKNLTASTGHVQAVTANWGALTEGWSIGHLSVIRDAANTIYDGSDSAYSGETAWDRMRRLAEEEGIPLARIAGQLETERVGPQRPEKLVELLAASADADGGMLLEDRKRIGLVFRDRSSLYTQEPALTLVYGEPGLAPPLKPVDDDKETRNDRTITRDGGSSARAVLETGRLSVQPPPAGIGLYDDSQTLSLADDVQTEPRAYWELHLGTYDGARYPAVRLLLHRAPHLIPDVLKLREGDLLRLKGLPPWVAFGDVDLIVTGWSETLKPYTWEITFVCAAGGPWNVAKASHLVFGKAGTDASTLANPVTDTATALDVNAANGLPWVADPQESPWDIEFGGEVARVAAVGTLINENPFFTKDAAGWSGQSSGVSRSTLAGRVHPKGVASLQIVPDGVAASGGATTGMSGVGTITPGASYTVSMWVFSAGGWADLRPAVDWFDAAGGFLSSGLGSGFVVPAGTWTFLSQTLTAPALASRASTRARHGGTPAPANTWYAWAIRLISPSAVAVGQRLTVERSANGVVKPHAAGTAVRLAHPAPASL